MIRSTRLLDLSGLVLDKRNPSSMAIQLVHHNVAAGQSDKVNVFCQGCHEAEMRKITTGAVLRELEMLLFDGLDLQAAVAQLKAAHALKPGDPSVNTHLHEALDQRMRELCGC